MESVPDTFTVFLDKNNGYIMGEHAYDSASYRIKPMVVKSGKTGVAYTWYNDQWYKQRWRGGHWLNAGETCPLHVDSLFDEPIKSLMVPDDVMHAFVRKMSHHLTAELPL